MQPAQKTGKFRLHRAGQQYGDDSAIVISDSRFERRAHLLVVPSANAGGANKHRHGARAIQRFFNLILPGITGKEIPVIKPNFQPVFFKLTGKPLNRSLVGFVVGEEDGEIKILHC
jgi:hypothetical protein